MENFSGILLCYWQLIQSFSHVVFGVTADMDAIRLVYFMMEKFPEYFKVSAKDITYCNIYISAEIHQGLGLYTQHYSIS